MTNDVQHILCAYWPFVHVCREMSIQILCLFLNWVTTHYFLHKICSYYCSDKYSGAPPWNAPSSAPLVAGLTMWLALANKIWEERSTPSRSFKHQLVGSPCLLFVCHKTSNLFQRKVVPSAWVPEWRWHGTEPQLITKGLVAFFFVSHSDVCGHLLLQHNLACAKGYTCPMCCVSASTIPPGSLTWPTRPWRSGLLTAPGSFPGHSLNHPILQTK